MRKALAYFVCMNQNRKMAAFHILGWALFCAVEVAFVRGFGQSFSSFGVLSFLLFVLLFIDINMPDVKGTELVRSLENKPMVIFTTAYKNYALEGFDLDAIDYLVKPENDNLFVRAEYQLVKIPFRDIDYIECVEDYLKIHIADSRPVMTLMTMKAVLEKLPPSQFARIHRSYIVSLSKIKSVVNRKVNLGNVELPVSSNSVDFIKEWTKQ